MPIDTSMYALPAAPAPSNPLQTMQSMYGIQQQANANKLFPLLYQGQQIQNQGAQVQVDTQKLNLAHQGFQIMSQGLGALAQDPRIGTPQGHDLLVNFGQQMVRAGLMTPEMFADEVKQMPTDPTQLPQYVQTLNVRAQDAANQFQQIYGAPSMVNNGQTQTPVATSPITGQRQIGAPIQNQMTPAEQNAPTPIGTDAQGRPIMGTAKQFIQKATGDDQGQMAPQNTTDAVQGPAGQPAQLSMPSQQPAPTGLASGPAPGGGIVMGLPPGAAEGKVVDAQASAQQGIQLQTTADAVPARKNALTQLLADSAKFTSGPLADQINTLKAMGNQLGITNFDPGSVAGQEGFNKLAKQIALAQTSALGVGTDEKLTTALGANPNSNLSNLGIEQITHLLLGNEDAIAAKNQAWQQYKAQNGPQTYGQFSTEFNKTFDPRVFQSMYMSPQERAESIKGMDGTERSKFVASLRTAVQNGWVSLGQQAPSPAPAQPQQ